jgi:catechol 2,3-dioxygenase-like lactoylglutathione lyase family enzyme
VVAGRLLGAFGADAPGRLSPGAPPGARLPPCKPDLPRFNPDAAKAISRERTIRPPGASAMTSHGLHHVTAIAGDVRRNLAFYTRTLGLRPRQEDRELRRPRHLSRLLRRRDGLARHDPDLLPWAHVAPGRPRRRARLRNRFSGAGRRDRLVDASLRRDGRAARNSPEALRRDRAALQGPGRDEPRPGRRRRGG